MPLPLRVGAQLFLTPEAALGACPALRAAWAAQAGAMGAALAEAYSSGRGGS
jgi:hypothetical protein